MKIPLLIATSLLIAATYANGQTPVVTINGAVSANGTITGNGVNSSGSAGGQLSLTQGVGPSIIPFSFSLAAPLTISSSFQATVPAAAANGIWRGTQAVSATATATTSGTPNYIINGLSLTSGSGYTTTPTCSISIGTGASCTPTMVGGVVTAVSASGGSGYSSLSTVTFTAAPTGGVTATGLVNLSGTSVMSVSLTSGSGYTTAPGCLITPVTLGLGSGATCSAAYTTTGQGQVSGLTITNAGTGYSAGANVSFVPQIAMAFSELSSDATTSGSNVVTVGHVNGVSFPASPSATNTLPVVTSTSSGGAVTYEALPVAAIASIAAHTVIGNSTGSLATPAAVQVTSLMTDTSIAPTAGPTFTGTVTVPTVATSSNTTVAASTAFVKTATFMVWSGYAPGSFTGSNISGRWTTPAAITVTGFDLVLGQAGAGCSPTGVLAIYDTTASSSVISITLVNGTTGYSVSGPFNVSTGHILELKNTTISGGCGTSPQIAQYSMTYQMQ